MKKITEEDRKRLREFQKSGENFSKNWTGYGKYLLYGNIILAIILLTFYILYYLKIV